MGVNGWRDGDLNGYAWSQAFAKACEIAEEEERVEALNYGRHASGTEAEIYEGKPKRDMLSRCGTFVKGQQCALDDTIWYNHGINQFIRVKDASRVTVDDPALEALRGRLRKLAGQNILGLEDD